MSKSKELLTQVILTISAHFMRVISPIIKRKSVLLNSP